MSRQTLLDRARRAKVAAMSGRCTISRFTPATIDTATLNLVDGNPDDDLQYDGPFRIKSPSSAVLAVDSTTGQLVTGQQLLLCIPIEKARGLRIDDKVLILDGGLEPGLTAQKFRIVGAFAQSYATEARLPIMAQAS